MRGVHMQKCNYHRRLNRWVADLFPHRNPFGVFKLAFKYEDIIEPFVLSFGCNLGNYDAMFAWQQQVMGVE